MLVVHKICQRAPSFHAAFRRTPPEKVVGVITDTILAMIDTAATTIQRVDAGPTRSFVHDNYDSLPAFVRHTGKLGTDCIMVYTPKKKSVPPAAPHKRKATAPTSTSWGCTPVVSGSPSKRRRRETHPTPP